jgi:hypothetical protein
MTFMGSLLLVYLILVMPLSAQESAVVPGSIGVNMPQAVAEINRAGLRLGNRVVVG